MDNDNGLSPEEMDQIVEEHKNVFALKDKMADILNNQPSNDCFLALRMMFVQFLCDTCTDKDAAIEMVAAMTGSSIMILNSMDEMGACAWNYKDQTLQ